ncbi:MAG: Uma2 family endonuclease [Candidatus Binatia bacterium]
MHTHTQPMQSEARRVSPAETEQRVILYGVSWETYERLLAEHEESSGTHFTYDQGRLEIMVLSAKHEKPSRVLALLVEVLAEEMGIDVEDLGSTTFKRKDLGRGFEPDSCFYVQNAERVRGKDNIDLTTDPPPDLLIEIDITSPSLNKQPLFAALGIPEVWRYDGTRVMIVKLEAGEYVETPESIALPGVTSEALSHLLAAGIHEKRTAWLRQVREWARTRRTVRG